MARITKRLNPARSEANAVPTAKPSGRLWTKRTRKTSAEVRAPEPLLPMKPASGLNLRRTRTRNPTPAAKPSRIGVNRVALRPSRKTGITPKPVASAVPQAASTKTTTWGMAGS
jgi:hypothetical protein